MGEKIDTSAEAVARICIALRMSGHHDKAAFVKALNAERDALREMLGLATDHSGDMLDAVRLIAGWPDIAAILRGEAVAVPVEPTEEMQDAGWIDKEDVSPREIYYAMLAASPYAEKRDE